ncbi:caspase-8 isoform 2-T2 [Aulostomus maculatus]
MEFQKLLLDAGKDLRREEVKAIEFLCVDLLDRSSASVNMASDLFSRLRDKDCLTPERPHLLTELLLIIQHPTLIRRLRLPDLTSLTDRLISPFRRFLYNLSENITKDDLKQVKFLLFEELPRSKLDENVTILEVFLEMEKMDLLSDTNLTLLEKIICSVCPMLKGKIDQFKETQGNFSGPVAQETSRPSVMILPFTQTQVPESVGAPAPAEGLKSLAESSVNSSYTSVDFPNIVSSGNDYEELPHCLSRLNTQAQACTEESADALEVLPQVTETNDEGLRTYPMTSPKRGICLIINNHDFTNSNPPLRKREGTMIDERCLMDVFKWLGFDVLIKRDCKTEDMLYLIQELSNRDHSQADCLVCCILSHGKLGCVHGVDGRTVELKQLMEPFNGSQCRSLAEKPKLFFIQACQGTNEQRPVFLEADEAQSCISCDAVNAVNVKESIPSDADFLLGVATVPSFVSFRDKTRGTWYIQSLCKNLIKMVPGRCDIVSILTKVNADVSRKTDTHGSKKQMPQPAFTLTKRVVFPIPKDAPPTLSDP